MVRMVLVAVALLLCLHAQAQVLECNTNQHVVGHECVDCQAGTNRGGDDPTGPNSECDGINVCSSHEFATMMEQEDGTRQLGCKECPPGTAVQAPGDDLIQVSLGFSDPCLAFSCTRPEVQTGYNLDMVQESLESTSFSVTGVACTTGYAGASPEAINCADSIPHRVGPYSLAGCEACVAGNNFAPMIGLRQCYQCHECHHRNEVELTRCTTTTDRTCACAANFTGTPSSSTSPMSGCRPIPSNVETPVVEPTTRIPVDAYNLGTLTAHCQMWVRENHPTIAIINQHIKQGTEDVPGFGSCQSYCAHFYSRREATVCHGLCDIATLPLFLAGLSDVTVGEYAMCRNTFQAVSSPSLNITSPSAANTTSTADTTSTANTTSTSTSDNSAPEDTVLAPL